MRDLALEAIVREPGYYLLGTARDFGRLAQGTPERYRDHWQTRKDNGSREEWEANEDIRHLLGPPTPLQESQYAQAEALITLFQPARLGPTDPAAGAGGRGGAGARGREPRREARRRGLPGAGGGRAAAGGGRAGGAARALPLPREPLLALLAAGGLTTLVTLATRVEEPHGAATCASRAHRVAGGSASRQPE